jgi:hypothetical protein
LIVAAVTGSSCNDGEVLPPAIRGAVGEAEPAGSGDGATMRKLNTDFVELLAPGRGAVVRNEDREDCL